MGIAYNTSIVRDGLVLHLDAANPKSYPGSGNTWFDLSGNRFHMTLYNSPTFNNVEKVFELDGVSQYGASDGTAANSVSATASNMGLTGSQQRTVICTAWVREQGSASAGLFDFGNTGIAGQHFCLRLNLSYVSWRAQFWGTPDYDFNYDGRNKWSMYSVVYPTDLIGKTYVNGAQLVGEDASPFELVTAGVRPFEMGRYGGTNFGGFRIASYIVYNRALSTQEIQTNFEALRGRYGI